MMWLVIAAILLAAAIQGIGYYREAVILYQLKSDAMGAASNVKSSAAQNQGIINQAVVDEGLANTKWSQGTTNFGKSQSASVYSVTTGNPEITRSVVYCSEDGITVVPNSDLPAFSCGGTVVASPPSSGGTSGSGGDSGTGGTTTPLTGTTFLAGWGNNGNSQLGIDPASVSTTQVSTPVDVSGGSLLDGTTITSASGAYAHGCAAANNEVYCWGYNDYLKLGDPSAGGQDQFYAVPRPIHVLGLPAGTVTAVATSEKANCALISGSVYCWGGNDEGAVGIGTYTYSEPPTKVIGLDGKTITSLVAGYRFICASDGHDVYCWGRNNYGQLGNGTTDNANVPTVISSLSGKNITSIDAQGYNACAVADGVPLCWGDNSDWAQIDPTYVDVWIPRALDMSTMNGKTATSVSVSEAGFCMIASDSNAYCWGNDYEGALSFGDGSGASYYTPQKVTLPGPVTSLEMGDYYSCALSNGAVYCWGTSYYGNLGNGVVGGFNTTPQAVDTSGILAGKTIKQLVVGKDTTYVIYQ